MATKATKSWSFLTNPFQAATRHSYRAMKKVGNYTLFAINARVPAPAPEGGGEGVAPTTPTLVGGVDAGPFFTDLKAMLAPLVNDFNAKYLVWTNQQGSRKGSVSTLAEKLALLRGPHIQLWDALVQTTYPQNSPRYNEIFPKRRTPFQKGSQMERVTAVEALYSMIKDNEELPPALKLSVAGCWEGLQFYYEKNTAQKSKSASASDELENARVALCTGMYRVLGKLMDFYAGDTEQIEAFFDLQSIRTIEQTVFTHGVKGGMMHMVFMRGLEAEDQLKIENTGETMLRFYLAETDGAQPGAMSVMVEADSSKTVNASELGNIAGHCLMVKNESAQLEGHFTVTLL